MKQMMFSLNVEFYFNFALGAIAIIAGVILGIVYRKEKCIVGLITIGFLVLMLFWPQHVIEVYRDIKDESIVKYVGTYEVLEGDKDTIILHDAKKTKLLAAVSVPDPTDEQAVILYSKRSELIGYFSFLSEYPKK